MTDNLATDNASTKPKRLMLIFCRRKGPYKCVHHEPRKVNGKPVSAGTGVNAMVEKSLLVFPGVNLVEKERYDLVKDNPGFKRAIDVGEIFLPDKKWKDIDETACVEEVKKSANLRTLADLLEDEKREPVAQALEVALEVATRGVRKEKPHLTPTQIARMGRQR